MDPSYHAIPDTSDNVYLLQQGESKIISAKTVEAD